MVNETGTRRRRLYGSVLVLLVCAIGAVRASTAAGGTVCIPSSEPTKLESGPASAGYISNLTNGAGSIRAESHRMLAAAIETAQSKNPANWVKFTAIPTLAKDSGDADQMCARNEEATRKQPLEFAEKHFDSVDDMTSWIMDFTRGKGDEGKSLYKQCPGDCSPQYTWWVEPQQNGMTVKPSAVCGMPRDRDGNMYELTTAIAPPCTD